MSVRKCVKECQTWEAFVRVHCIVVQVAVLCDTAELGLRVLCSIDTALTKIKLYEQ